MMRYKMRIQRVNINTDINYQDLIELAPKEYPVVSVYNKVLDCYENVIVHRKYVSYGVSPEFKYTGKSYMFNNQVKDVPLVLNKLLEIAKHIDSRFNNIYVNWYADGNDYIDPHSDCINSLISGSPILIMNFNSGEFCRTFKLQSKINEADYKEILLTDKLGIILGSQEQTMYRHWVDKEDTHEGRISVTFRAVRTIEFEGATDEFQCSGIDFSENRE